MELVNLIFQLLNLTPLKKFIRLNSHEVNMEQTNGSYIAKKEKEISKILLQHSLGFKKKKKVIPCY